jgi:hypothetical protein
MRNAHNILFGRPEGKKFCFVDVGVDGRITLEWLLEQSIRIWTVFTWVRTHMVVGSCERSNDLSVSMKHVEFLN